MWALDFYREGFGDDTSPVGMVLAWALVLSAVVGLGHALADARRSPAIAVALAGGVGFWWAAWEGHPWAGVGILLAAVAWGSSRQNAPNGRCATTPSRVKRHNER